MYACGIIIKQSTPINVSAQSAKVPVAHKPARAAVQTFIVAKLNCQQRANLPFSVANTE